MKKVLAVLAVVAVCGFAQAAITSSQTGTNNGYYYMLYLSGGSASMTLGSAGNFAVSWSGVGDIVAGKGWNPGSSRTVGYNCGSYSNSGGGSFGLYGWTTNPLIEYYVVEIGNPAAGSCVGSVSSDGGTYNIWKHQQVSQPSIVGTTTFWQYLSIRSSSNSQNANHTITTGNHFTAWKSKCGSMGTFNLMVIYAESWNGSGYCNATVW